MSRVYMNRHNKNIGYRIDENTSVEYGRNWTVGEIVRSIAAQGIRLTNDEQLEMLAIVASR